MSLPSHFGIFKVKGRGTKILESSVWEIDIIDQVLDAFWGSKSHSKGILHNGQWNCAGVFRTGDYQSSQISSPIVQLI